MSTKGGATHANKENVKYVEDIVKKFASIVMWALMVVVVALIVKYILSRKNKKAVCSRYEVGGDCVE